MTLFTDAQTCRGCRICELACSFHYHNVFSPELSSIRITRNNRNGDISISIDDSKCDLCPNQWCVSSCPFGALEVVS